MLKPVREHNREDTETECIEDRVLHIIREEETIEVSFIEWVTIWLPIEI